MRLNETLSTLWLPLLAGLAVGTLLGWLALGSTFGSINAGQGGPHNLQERHLDTFVSGLVPYAEEVNTSDDEDGRVRAFNEIAEALCYPAEDYTAVKARYDLLDPNEAPFERQQYEYVLDTFDQSTTCDQYLAIEGNEPVVSRMSGLGNWVTLLLFALAILTVGALLLNSRGVSLSNLNRPSTNQRQRRPRFSLDREDRGQDRGQDRGRDRDRDIDIPRYSRRSETSGMDVPSYESRPADESRSPEPMPELIPPKSEPDDQPSRSYNYEPEPEAETQVEAPIIDDDTGFTATYSRGDEAFERVFEIYGTDNQYLGDCSIEIADSLATDPADVTAFKIRLFEAGSPRSVTKLLMSEHAFNDSALKSRLATQGDAVLAQMGEPVTLEGKTITVDTYLTDLLYSNDNGQPVRSVFDRVTVKLKAFVNRPDDTDDGSNILEF